MKPLLMMSHRCAAKPQAALLAVMLAFGSPVLGNERVLLAEGVTLLREAGQSEGAARIGLLTEARAAFERIVADYPDNPIAQQLLGDGVQVVGGDPVTLSSVTDAANAAPCFDAPDPECLIGLALAALDGAESSSPKSYALAFIARVQMKAGDISAARDSASKALKAAINTEDNSLAFAAAAEALASSGQFNEALRIIDYIKDGGAKSSALAFVAAAHMMDGQTQLGKELFDDALKEVQKIQNTNGALSANTNVIKSLASMGEVDLMRAIASETGFSEALNNQILLGRAQAVSRQPDLAKQTLSAAIFQAAEREPGIRDIHLTLIADIQARNGDLLNASDTIEMIDTSALSPMQSWRLASAQAGVDEVQSALHTAQKIRKHVGSNISYPGGFIEPAFAMALASIAESLATVR